MATTNLSLYVIADRYRQDAAKLQEMGIDQQTMLDTLEAMGGELEEKSVNVAAFIRNLEATAKSIKEAEQAMAYRRKALETKAENIRQYLLDNMSRCGIAKIECPMFGIAVRDNPEALVIDDGAAVPDEFYDTRAQIVLNNSRLKSAIKDGLFVAGCRLERKQRLEIK